MHAIKVSDELKSLSDQRKDVIKQQEALEKKIIETTGEEAQAAFYLYMRLEVEYSTISQLIAVEMMSMGSMHELKRTSYDRFAYRNGFKR